MLSIYPACFIKCDLQYSVVFPDLNWLSTQGESIEEAMEKAIECLAGYIYTEERDGNPIPAPSKLSDVDVYAIANDLEVEYDPATDFVNMVSVDVADYAKRHFEKSVKKTLTIPSWLNAAALDMGLNFSQVLQEALISKVNSK